MTQRLLLFLLVFLFSCNQKNESQKDSSEIKMDTLSQNDTTVQEVDKDSWIDSFPENIKNIKDYFTGRTSRNFNCEIIEKYYKSSGTKLDTKDLVQIDSLTCKILFGDNESNYGDFCSSYFYSIEKPFLNFYPITVIQMFGVVERPLMLVLFDSNGKYLNSIEVADTYGETGGCLSSKFINDSTLTRNFQWINHAGIDSLGKDIFETTTKKEKVIFDRTGNYKIIEE